MAKKKGWSWVLHLLRSILPRPNIAYWILKMAKKEKKNARSKISEKTKISFFDYLKKFLMFVGSFVGILFVWSQVKAISGEPQASTVTNRDPRTKTGWSRTGPEPRKNSNSGTGPDQDQENLGPNRTRTENYFKTWDRTGPGPTKFWNSRFGPVGPQTRRPVDPCQGFPDQNVVGSVNQTVCYLWNYILFILYFNCYIQKENFYNPMSHEMD